MGSVGGREREKEGGSRMGKVSVHRFEIFSNTLWKISCSDAGSEFEPTAVDSVKLIREEEKEVIVRVDNTKRDKQVVGVCLAGVLWSSGGNLALKLRL